MGDGQSFTGKVTNILSSEGPIELLRRFPSYVYKSFVRPLVPNTGFYTHNEIPYKRKKLMDGIFYSKWSSNPDYEDALISQIRKEVESGDSVGIIGGGIGISTVAAAKATGRDGDVTVFEGSFAMVEKISNTIEINEMTEIVQVNHALVGPEINLFGKKGEAANIDLQELPFFDVLEMDCEGAELQILRQLSQKPKTIIIEIHPPEVQEFEVVELLNGYGYSIINRNLENECSNNPLPVLTATRRD